MKYISVRHFFCALCLIAGVLIVAGTVNPTWAEAAVVKETSRVMPGDPVTSSDMVTPTAPFAGGNERKAAHTVVTGESLAGPSLDVINYALAVGERTPDTLVLNCTLSKAEDRATLDRLANKIYKDSNGASYPNVVINWHLGAVHEVPAPWARTTMSNVGILGFVIVQPQ